MEHYVCKGGCGGGGDQAGACGTEGCSNKGMPFEQCNCDDGQHGSAPKMEAPAPSDEAPASEAPAAETPASEAPAPESENTGGGESGGMPQ
ncbi:MAG: hypothetical protein Q8Q06_02585 [bacterium]|nr:hypothetical protein [bacterium]